jgi:hypothetical protein
LDADALAEDAGGTYDTVSTIVHTAVADYAGLGKITLFKNGSIIAGPTAFASGAGNSGDTDSSVIAVGATPGSDFLDGDISEVIVYNCALSAAERRIAELYLGHEHGIRVAA